MALFLFEYFARISDFDFAMTLDLHLTPIKQQHLHQPSDDDLEQNFPNWAKRKNYQGYARHLFFSDTVTIFCYSYCNVMWQATKMFIHTKCSAYKGYTLTNSPSNLSRVSANTTTPCVIPWETVSNFRRACNHWTHVIHWNNQITAFTFLLIKWYQVITLWGKT